MLIDASQVRAEEANAVTDYLCKSVEDALLDDRHPTDEILAEVEDDSVAWVSQALDALQRRMLVMLRGGLDHAALVKAVPDDPLAHCRDLEHRARTAPPGSLSLAEYMDIVDCLMMRYLPPSVALSVAKRQAVKQYVAGFIRDEIKDPAAGTPDKARAMIAALTGTLAEAKRRWTLHPTDEARIRLAETQGARMMTDLTAATRSRIQKVILDAERRRVVSGYATYAGPPLAQALADEFGTINRDWRRIAVTETANNAADGYLSARGVGQQVRWLAHPGACVGCATWHATVFTIVDPAKPDKDPYTEVWPGKAVMNVGRSLAKRKRLDDGTLVDRPADEFVIPVISLHPHCRCSWVPVSTHLLTEKQRRILDEEEIQHV